MEACSKKKETRDVNQAIPNIRDKADGYFGSPFIWNFFRPAFMPTKQQNTEYQQKEVMM